MNDLAPISGLPSFDDLSDDDLSGPTLDIPQRAKAAIVVAALLNDDAELRLTDLPEESQEQLARSLAEMRLIDRDTLQSILAEFTDELERVGMAFPDGMSGALNALDGRISPHTAQRLRKEAGVRQSGDPWQRISGLSAEALLPILETESIEVCAVVLSKINTKRAAELLSMIPGPRARQITYAVSPTSRIRADAVDRIGLAIAAQLDAQPDDAFIEGPVRRVGAILNNSSIKTRDDILEGLDEQDIEFAAAVRKAIFTFGNIAQRVDPRDVPKITREIEPTILVTALAAAESEEGMKKSAEFILGNMSKRMAEQYREEIAELGKVKSSDADQAITEVVARIRAMESEGQLIFLSEDDA